VFAICCGTSGRFPAAAQEVDPFDGFMSPVTNPVNFEDPRATTEVRPLYVYHKLSNDFAKVVGADGGDAHVAAVQARLALTDRLAFIATKDGYVWLRPAEKIPGVLENENGFANVALGAKYALYRDPERRAIATLGLRYEIPMGNRDVFQGHGDGVFNPFLSAGWGVENLAGIGDLHLLGYTAVRVPVSGDDSTFFDLSLHADYGIHIGPEGWGPIYPLVELNWIHVLADGDRLPLDQEGFDFFNFGTSKSAGKGVVTMAVGMRYRIADNLAEIFGRKLGIDIGAAWEAPVTDREDIFGWRVTTDLIFHLI